MIPCNSCKNMKWKLDTYEADGYYIKECYDNNGDKHVYMDENLCYYNTIALKKQNALDHLLMLMLME